MTYQEAVELLQQLCNDLLNRQQDRGIAFAARPKIEEALIAFSRCIQNLERMDEYRVKCSEQEDEIETLQDQIIELENELNQLKSVHLAAEHGEAFEETIPAAVPLVVEDINMGGGWIENTGEQPVDDGVWVETLLADGTTGTDVAESWDWSLGLDDFGRIDYWRLSNA